ncbi:YciI family protein [Cellulomonas composti]|uniref:Transcription initiation protein n=1 Tax=Cellulomonas composti TaxID=266130 RepID=A0A511JA38_9CELL|nr:YciI family protein [Cellulomonas composti]GEL94844.1 transcription initiation protein [Cellulomonas composti]
MQFISLVIEDPSAEPYDPALDNIQDWVREGTERGILLRGDRLRPVAEAQVVARRDGEVLVTQGPFAELTELVAGYDVLECTDLDEAIEFVARHPMARFGAIELRPVWPFDEEA